MKDREFEGLAEQYVAKIQQLTSHHGYFERFFEICSETPTYKAAWEALEEERAGFGLPEKYTSYESFRVGKTLHINSLIRINTETTADTE